MAIFTLPDLSASRIFVLADGQPSGKLKKNKSRAARARAGKLAPPAPKLPIKGTNVTNTGTSFPRNDFSQASKEFNKRPDAPEKTFALARVEDELEPQKIPGFLDSDWVASLPEEIRQVYIQLDALKRSMRYCPICAWPRHRKQAFESDFMLEGADPHQLCLDHEITIGDLRFHITECIIGKDTSIPQEALFKLMMLELSDFLRIFQQYKIQILDGDLSPDTMVSYGNLLHELRLTITHIKETTTPQSQGLAINRGVLSPLLINSFQDIVAELQTVRDEIRKIVPQNADNRVKTQFDELTIKIGTFIKNRVRESQEKLGEVLGVAPEEFA